MKRLVLHLGSSKTGTSSLQHLFSNNYEALLQQNILYPQACRNHDGLQKLRHFGLKYIARTLVDSGDIDANGYKLSQSVFTKEEAQDCLDELDAEINAAKNAETVVISNEGFAGRMTPEEVNFLSNWFGERFDKVDLVFCVREPFGNINSGYSQAVKEGSTSNWKNFVQKRLDVGAFKWKITQWSENFKSDSFTVFPMHPDNLDFFGSYIKFDISRLTESSRRRNIGLTPLGAMVMREVNVLSKDISPNIRKQVRRNCVRLISRNMTYGPSVNQKADIEKVFLHSQSEIEFLRNFQGMSSDHMSMIDKEWKPGLVQKKLAKKAEFFLSRKSFLPDAKKIAKGFVSLAVFPLPANSAEKNSKS